MSYWNPTKYAVKSVINTFGNGINTGLPPFQIDDSEATYLRNLDSREYPSIATRPPRSTYAAPLSTNVNGLGHRNNATLHVIDNNTWKYWVPASSAYTNLTTTLSTNAKGELGEFVTNTDRYTFLMNSTQKLIWDGSSTALTLGDANTPYTNLFTVHKGRIYALSGATVYYCALNATSDWTSANDAGNISITRAKGEGTAIYEYNDKVIVFTEFSLHELYGSGPTNYELVDVEGEVGCISDRSLIKVNRRLYWLWYDGVYEYDGSVPVKISDPVDHYIENINFDYKSKCVAGSIGDFLYLSIPYNGATQNNLILKYDTRLKKWYIEDGAFTDFVAIGKSLYGVDTAGRIYNMRDESATEGFDTNGVATLTAINWSLITKPFNARPQDKQTLQDMYIVADVTPYASTNDATLIIQYSTNVNNNNSTTFSTLASVSPSTNPQNQRVQVPIGNLQNLDWYRLRLAGYGKVTIHSLQQNLRVKTR